MTKFPKLMKKLFYLFLLFTAFAIKTNAQSNGPSLEYRLYPGTVTTTDGQTIKGHIRNGDNQYNQKKCEFYGDMNDSRSRKTYSPADLASYTIENYQYKSINYSGGLPFIKASRNFVFVVKSGSITTFVYYTPDQQLVWQKGNEDPIGNASMLMSFKKNILKLVGDYPELAAKIQNKESGYGLLGIDKIVEEYNTWAASKK